MTAEVSSPGASASNQDQSPYTGRQPNSYMLGESPQKLWDTTIPQAQKQISDPIAWLAMQSARPLALEQNILVLAVPREVEYLVASLTDSAHQAVFTEILTSLTQRPSQLRVIVGESLQDWEVIRQREAPPPPVYSPPEISLPPVDENSTRRLTRDSLGYSDEKPLEEKKGPWDGAFERISRSLNQTPLRQYTQGRAHYFLNCIRSISDTMDQIIEEAGGLRTEQFERGVARAIDKLAQAVEFDPLLVALELERYREAHRKGIGDYSEAIKHTTIPPA